MPMDIAEKLKQVIVEDLNLEEVTPTDIEDDNPLFGEGLGLDSLDAVELVVVVKRHFGVEIKDMSEGREAFASINALTQFIEEHMAG
jgi:acyl carrier protein